ncbi:ent-kaurene synthase [Ranunculus cassubicifolius]
MNSFVIADLCFVYVDGNPNSRLQDSRRTKTAAFSSPQCAQGHEERIRKMFKKVELSVSSYDTAWVAMVPSLGLPQQPCFPECLNWLLENQLPDGSWSLPKRGHLLTKDSMLSTLACIMALKRWDIGGEHVKKGLDFMGSNFGAVTDKKQLCPIGFDIIFPRLIEITKDMDLKLPFNTNCIHTLLRNRDSEFDRLSRCNSNASKSYLAYVSEGLAQPCDMKEIIKYKMKNGSILNSPSTSAAFLIQQHDVECLEYLQSLLQVFGNAVPTMCPMDMYIRLRMIDRIGKLGIDRHFKNEIKQAMDETYRCWLQRDEEVFLDMEICALAFRLLRTNGYEVSSDEFDGFEKEEHFFNSCRNAKSIYTILELYKASEIVISPNEHILDKLNSWTRCLLKQELSNGFIQDERCRKEVSKNKLNVISYLMNLTRPSCTKQVYRALKFPYDANVERLENKKSIQHYNIDATYMLKGSYRCTNTESKDFLELAVEDFNFCQAMHQKELKNLEKWVKECRLDELTFARQKLTYIYFTAACILFPPELSDARTSWVKNTFLAVICDDFFDVGGSQEELANLIELVKRWDGNAPAHYYSENVEIIYMALHKTISDLGSAASTRQDRNVTSHLVEIWCALLRSFMQEFEWARTNLTPSLDEYIETAFTSFALGPIVPITLYFLGHKLSEEVVTSPEYNDLYKHMSICCRLRNDTQTFKREREQGKINSVVLCTIHACGAITEEEAVKEVTTIIDRNRRALQKMVLQSKGSIVPKECKDIFWKTTKINSLFYTNKDGFSSPVEMLRVVNQVLHDPLPLSSLC